MAEEVPEMQWSICLLENSKLEVKRIPVPKPESGFVLVKMMAAPINPSDVFMLKGIYHRDEIFKIDFPFVPGYEGAGIVVQNGGGIMGWRILGTRVSVAASNENNHFTRGACFQ